MSQENIATLRRLRVARTAAPEAIGALVAPRSALSFSARRLLDHDVSLNDGAGAERCISSRCQWAVSNPCDVEFVRRRAGGLPVVESEIGGKLAEHDGVRGVDAARPLDPEPRR